MPVGELFLSAFLQVLFDRLASPELLQFARQEGIHSKMKKREKMLMMIHAVLDDAEEKQLKNRAVKIWLDDLRDLAYDVEDTLDEFATDAFAKALKLEQNQQASTSKARNLLPACFNNWSPRAIKFSIRMRSEIKNVTSRLEELCKLRDNLGLKEITGGTSSHVPGYRTRPTTSLQTETIVHGRNEDAAKILDMVLSTGESSGDNFRVISIVGMGGIGKTTLAQKVFNDEAVKDFNPKAWTCVSVDFDVLRISKAILESITGSPCILTELDAVQKKLQEAVAGKKFLLVLDDVWSKDLRPWELLRTPFKAGAVGSKIIVTTRDKVVASTMGALKESHLLKLLSDDECWSLFKAHAFEFREIASFGDIGLIRQKVIEKCEGLPLAVKTLAGLLRLQEREDEWLEILNSKIWDFLEEKDDIPATLKVSYYYLPSHLKRCFAHCAIFLEDYEFLEEELIHLWMAEGLIQPSKENRQLEDLGHAYFNALLSSSFFQQSSVDESKHTMHDLVRDLAKWASGGTCYHLEDMTEANKPQRSFKKVRHLSFARGEYDGKCKFEVLKEVEQVDQCLRTFLPLFNTFYSSYITQTVILDLLPKFKKLRMLSLEGYEVTELPESIGDLRHLRFLNLSRTNIKSLPESTSSLFHLQILKLNGCCRLKKLPSKIRNLINLRYLDIRDVDLDEMPLGMNELKYLRYLSNFVVGKGFGIGLEYLKLLKSLCGELCISRLENVDLHETREMILNDKQKLKVLQLEWTFQFDDTRNEVREKEVLGLLRPHPNLEELEIKFYGGLEFPSWVGDSSFSKITSLTLFWCDKCTLLPSLGMLGSLKDLTIRWMKGLKSIGKEICGQRCSTPFQSLQTLCFEYLEEWEHWEPIEESEYGRAFPSLREFSIKYCPKLSGRLPDCLPSLEKLVIKDCKQLEVSFSSLPMLCELEIDGCKELACNSPMDSKSLKSMTLVDISEFGNWLRQQNFLKVEHLNLKITGCEQLINLWQLNETFLERPPQGLQSFIFISELLIENCSNLASFTEVCFLSNLSKLEIRECNALISLPKGMGQDCNSLTFIVRGKLPSSLKKLEIENCEKLEYLWDDNEESCTSVVDEENSNNTTRSLLEYLNVTKCPSLKCLSSNGMLPETLQHLNVEDCNSLTFIVRGKLPSSLKKLEIENCDKLEYLWDDNGESCTSVVDEENPINTNTSLLEYLLVLNCPSLKCLSSSGHLPQMLRTLSLYYLPHLESIAESFHNNKSLEEINVRHCKNLKSVLLQGLHNLCHLRRIVIDDCETIDCLGEEGPANTNLSELEISNCENLKALPNWFHSPNSLKSLTLWKCPMNKAVLEWGLHNLTSLTSLWIWGLPEAESFPKQELEMTFPPSLTLLSIYDFPNLKCLMGEGFRNLYSLASLKIGGCPNLTSFPEIALPSSLSMLQIRNCPEVRSFPEQGLPSSLLELHIWGCPKLKEECKRDKRKEWSKISHIPYVEIDGKYIFYPWCWESEEESKEEE